MNEVQCVFIWLNKMDCESSKSEIQFLTFMKTFSLTVQFIYQENVDIWCYFLSTLSLEMVKKKNFIKAFYLIFSASMFCRCVCVGGGVMYALGSIWCLEIAEV